ncbi:MAG: AMP-binding protein, partial [Alphaproteobacteria bacterium]|nr:AMP-binding protein [Alphaproteobacteria bacterium]
MDFKTCPSLPAMLFDEAAQQGDKPFLWAKSSGSYRPITWREAARQVSALSRGLRALGIERGDRVALISENRPEWLIADFAIMAAGAITVPAYTTNTVEDHRHVLSNSGARAVIVSQTALSARVIAAANQVDAVQTAISIEPAAGQASAVDLLSWNEVVARSAEEPNDTMALVA